MSNLLWQTFDASSNWGTLFREYNHEQNYLDFDPWFHKYPIAADFVQFTPNSVWLLWNQQAERRTDTKLR